MTRSLCSIFEVFWSCLGSVHLGRLRAVVVRMEFLPEQVDCSCVSHILVYSADGNGIVSPARLGLVPSEIDCTAVVFLQAFSARESLRARRRELRRCIQEL